MAMPSTPSIPMPAYGVDLAVLSAIVGTVGMVGIVGARGMAETHKTILNGVAAVTKSSKNQERAFIPFASQEAMAGRPKETWRHEFDLAQSATRSAARSAPSHIYSTRRRRFHYYFRSITKVIGDRGKTTESGNWNSGRLGIARNALFDRRRRRLAVVINADCDQPGCRVAVLTASCTLVAPM